MGQALYTILWFFLFFIEVWLVVSIFIDVFRSHDLKGWAKALWIILVLVFPLVGILAYFIVRGDKMRAHQIRAPEFPADTRSVTDELSKLAELRRDGTISEDEFQQLKVRLLRDREPSDL